MTTFWLNFTDPKKNSSDRFLGVAIFDMEEDKANPLTVTDIVRHSHHLKVNPGGSVSVQEIDTAIPDEHKNKLITDDAMLAKLGSRGRIGQ